METKNQPEDMGGDPSQPEGSVKADSLDVASNGFSVDRQVAAEAEAEAEASEGDQGNIDSAAESQDGAKEASVAESADIYPALAENVRTRLLNICNTAFQNLDSVRKRYEQELIAKGWNERLFIDLTQRLKNAIGSLIDEEFSDEELSQRLSEITLLVREIRSSNRAFFDKNKDCRHQLEAIDNHIHAITEAVPIIVEARNLARDSQRERLTTTE